MKKVINTLLFTSTFLLIASCGGGSSPAAETTPDTVSDNWGEMNWDQGNWQ